MTPKHGQGPGGPGNAMRDHARAGSTGSRSVAAAGAPADRAGRIALLILVLVLASVVVIGADFVIGAVTNSGGGTGPTATPVASSSPAGMSGQTPNVAATAAQVGVVVQGDGGHWTNVGPDQLAQVLAHKDVMLLNVKTPYVGEIDGTDLYVAYNQLAARTAHLPPDKSARVLVYCRSGVQSAQATQTLLNLGYTNVWNLDGGMNAWQSSGRTLVDKGRT